MKQQMDSSFRSRGISSNKNRVYLIIDVSILNGVVIGTNLSENSTFYGLMTGVQNSITSGYSLLAHLILMVGADAILHFFSFI